MAHVSHLEDPEQIESRGGYLPRGILPLGPARDRQDPDGRGGGWWDRPPYVFVDPGAFISMLISMLMGVGMARRPGPGSAEHAGPWQRVGPGE